MDSEVEVYRAPVRVAGRNGGHRQGWWSQAGLLVAGRADSGRQGWWSQAGLTVAGRAGGRRQGWWSQAGLVVAGRAAQLAVRAAPSRSGRQLDEVRREKC